MAGPGRGVPHGAVGGCDAALQCRRPRRDPTTHRICHPPGQPNDTHYHQHDEWWVVLRGEIDWWLEDQVEPIRAKAGDIVFCPKYTWHHIEPTGAETTIRLGIKEPSEFHRYDRPGCRSKPWRLKPGETPATAAPQED